MRPVESTPRDGSIGSSWPRSHANPNATSPALAPSPSPTRPNTLAAHRLAALKARGDREAVGQRHAAKTEFVRTSSDRGVIRHRRPYRSRSSVPEMDASPAGLCIEDRKHLRRPRADAKAWAPTSSPKKPRGPDQTWPDAGLFGVIRQGVVEDGSPASTSLGRTTPDDECPRTNPQV